jgi:hypothetical protein
MTTMKTNPSIASAKVEEVSDGQIENCVTLIVDATRKSAGAVLRELAKSGVLNKKNIEQVRTRGNEVVADIIEAVKNKFAELAENIRDCVKLISGAKMIIIKAVDGQTTIASSNDVFTGGKYGSFGNAPSQPTKDTSVKVYEMVKDGAYAQIFGGMSDDINRLCLTENQIVRFVQDHRDWLRTEGYGTFFLYKEGEEFFVARVYLSSVGPGVGRDRLSDDVVWRALGQRRVVVPQPKPSIT